MTLDEAVDALKKHVELFKLLPPMYENDKEVAEAIRDLIDDLEGKLKQLRDEFE